MVELLENSWASLLYYQPAFCFACERMLMFAARMVKSRCIEAIFRHLENFFKANPGLYVMIDEIRRRYPTGHPVPNVAPASAKFYFDTNVYDFNVVLTWMLPMLAIYKNQAHVRGSKTVLSSNRLNNAMRYLRGFLLARKMSEDERLHLLSHLKSKWEEVNSVYQKMTFTLDTPAKQKRKENYELTLSQIEKDIQKLEKGNIFVQEDL